MTFSFRTSCIHVFQTTIPIFLFLFFALPADSSGTDSSSPDDQFIKGYATALMKDVLRMEDFELRVNSGIITVSAVNLSIETKDRITRKLSEISETVRVKFHDPATQGILAEKAPETPVCETWEETTGFLPKGYLFAPLLADPRWPRFSATYQYYKDNSEFRNIGAVSFGGSFGLYRGDMWDAAKWQVDIAAGVFSIFDLDTDSYDLVNTDFWVAFPQLSCRWGGFSALSRLFHQSSHLGDEYLLRTGAKRVNLSYEGVDLILSYDVEIFRIYGGGEYLLHRNPDDLDRKSLRAGAEMEFPVGFMNNRIVPVAALDTQFVEEYDWGTNFSARAGLEFKRSESDYIRYQLMAEYYKGYSPNGQFYTDKVESTGVGLHILY